MKTEVRKLLWLAVLLLCFVWACEPRRDGGGADDDDSGDGASDDVAGDDDDAGDDAVDVDDDDDATDDAVDVDDDDDATDDAVDVDDDDDATDDAVDVDDDDDDDDSGAGDGLQLCSPMPSSDPFTQESASINGDALELIVSYGGGCEVHEFELCWGGEVMESAPPQVSVTVIHEDNDDSCLALLTEMLNFDLSPLQALVSGEVIVHVGGESLNYTF